MSDQPETPPKPKPGSLRDRIAAFEKSAAAPATAGPVPAPRPKPAGFASWKPKPASPPSSPAKTDEPAIPATKPGGMSATDAKESIGKGGSLKDRMAALQGKGAFGSPPPIAPKPALEKPKWKPPPVVAVPDDNENEEGGQSTAPLRSPPPTQESHGDESAKKSGEEETSAPTEGEEQGADDPVEEERQRRAAIAARMARLGGARVGMGPPVFGTKPVPKRQSTSEGAIAKTKEVSPKSEVTTEDDDDNAGSASIGKDTVITSSYGEQAPILQSSPQPDLQPSSEYFPARKNSESASFLSTESDQSSRSPSSMPVPSVPRRTGPPRRKPAKAPVSSVSDEKVEEEARVEPPVPTENIHLPDQASPEAGRLGTEQTDLKKSEDGGLDATSGGAAHHDERVEEKLFDDAIHPEPDVASVAPKDIHHEEEHAVHGELSRDDEGEVEVQAKEDTIAHATEETEDDEEARKKRIAERLAKMGGVNPLALPPQRKSSSSSDVARSPPVSPPARSSSFQRGSFGSLDAPTRKDSVRMSSIDSSIVHEEPAEIVTLPSESVEHTSRQDSIMSVDSVSDLKSRIDDEQDIQDDDNHPDQATLATSTLPETDSYSDTDEVIGQDKDHSTKFERKYSSHEGKEHKPVHRTLHPQSEPVSDNDEDENKDEHLRTPVHRYSTPKDQPAWKHPSPPRRLVPQDDEDDINDDDDNDVDEGSDNLAASTLFVPPPRQRDNEEEDLDNVDTDNDSVPLPVPHRRSMQNETQTSHTSEPTPHTGRRIPSPKAVKGSGWQQESDSEDALPTRPRSIPSQDNVAKVETPPSRPPVPQTSNRTHAPPNRPAPIHRTLPPPPQRALSESSEQLSSILTTPSVSVSDQEILDDDEGDPIDPAFHSPSRRASTLILSGGTPSPPIPQASTELPAEAEEQKDAEQARRQTIADRMAKLGGIKFGAAPLPSVISKQSAQQHEEGSAAQSIDVTGETAEVDEEEEERARKERIAAKLSTMGGMRIGMMPMGVHQPRPHVPQEKIPISSGVQQRATPPTRPPPATQQIETDSEKENSEDGVKVEAEESEIEEVGYEEVQEEEAPPIPSRSGRQVSGSGFSSHNRESTGGSTQGYPPVPMTRPPVPSGQKRSSVQTTSSGHPVIRKQTGESDASAQRRPSIQRGGQSEYVMVEEPRTIEQEDISPPSRSATGGRAPPSRTMPPPPPPSQDPSDSISSPWELPSIPRPTIDFGPDADLSLSWTDAADPSAEQPRAPAAAPAPVTAPVPIPKSPEELHMNSDELIAVWGRVGVQICEVATTLFDKSRKGLIGDGTYPGFVDAVLAEVPNAVQYGEHWHGYGYAVYVQSGSVVQKRVSDIMPGDIVELVDARLKGHKGLQTYHQEVGGGGERVVGIISEFEPKKSKVRVFQANKHVGQQTVEAVSYRLEDLKSGTVKVYRVLEV